ncbi:hypothetical protein BDV19DRAFT_385849 [Aspergillus venezuelensis]
MASDLTLAILGCGNMGSAILAGILDATSTPEGFNASPISRIIACTKSRSSAEKLKSRYAESKSKIQLEFRADANAKSAQEANVIMLGCKPYLVDAVLAEEGLSDALAGKLVVSVIAGKTIHVLAERIASSQYTQSAPTVVRAIPNVAASVRESMTIVELPQTASEDDKNIVSWMLSQIGTVKTLNGELFDCGSTLMASLATLSVAVDGILDGCVVEGMKRAEASEMTAQCLLGLAKMLQDGHHPAILRESIASPRGCTIQSLLAVEKASVRHAFADSIIAGTQHLKRLQEDASKK